MAFVRLLYSVVVTTLSEYLHRTHSRNVLWKRKLVYFVVAAYLFSIYNKYVTNYL